jgi:hypothetical protein
MILVQMFYSILAHLCVYVKAQKISRSLLQGSG